MFYRRSTAVDKVEVLGMNIHVASRLQCFPRKYTVGHLHYGSIAYAVGGGHLGFSKGVIAGQGQSSKASV